MTSVPWGAVAILLAVHGRALGQGEPQRTSSEHAAPAAPPPATRSPGADARAAAPQASPEYARRSVASDRDDDDGLRPRSRGAYAAGLALAITGVSALLVGGLLSVPYVCNDTYPRSNCGPLVPRLIGISMIESGTVGVTVGLPLAIWGSSRIPESGAHAGRRPGVSGTWTF
jgi:hypothetical protein